MGAGAGAGAGVVVLGAAGVVVPPVFGGVVPPAAGAAGAAGVGVVGLLGFVLPEPEVLSVPVTAVVSWVLPWMDGSTIIWLNSTVILEPSGRSRLTVTVTVHSPLTELFWSAVTDQL